MPEIKPIFTGHDTLKLFPTILFLRSWNFVFQNRKRIVTKSQIGKKSIFKLYRIFIDRIFTVIFRPNILYIAQMDEEKFDYFNNNYYNNNYNFI